MLKNILKLFKVSKKPRAIILRHQGQNYNLKEIYDEVNEQYFEGKLDLRITWFGPKRSQYQRRIVLGSYHYHHKLVRVSSILDQADIPAYYIHFIVYHEMLHHVYPPIIRNRKRQIHHAVFKQKEKEFQAYDLVKDFKKNSKQRWFVD